MGLFQPSERSRRATAVAATALLPGPAPIRAVGFGFAPARFTTPIRTTIGVLVMLFAIAALNGVVLAPGVFLIVFIARAIRPPRALVFTEAGDAVLFDRSFWRSLPKHVISSAPASQVTTMAGKTRGVTLDVGGAVVTMTTKEYDHLTEARAQGAS